MTQHGWSEKMARIRTKSEQTTTDGIPAARGSSGRISLVQLTPALAMLRTFFIVFLMLALFGNRPWHRSHDDQ
jgi:hypothetical protein